LEVIGANAELKNEDIYDGNFDYERTVQFGSHATGSRQQIR
jgi:hypothetical protein